MKVSITFDKDTKQTNKKQWVRQIQDVVQKLNTKSKTEIVPMSPKYSPETSMRKEYPQSSVSSTTQFSDANLIAQLVAMQKIMQDKFSILTKSICKLSDKLTNVQKRVNILQQKQQIRQQIQQDFDKQFAQISLKYDRLRRQSINSQTSQQINRKNMGETAQTRFSFVRNYQDRSI